MPDHDGTGCHGRVPQADKNDVQMNTLGSSSVTLSKRVFHPRGDKADKRVLYILPTYLPPSLLRFLERFTGVATRLPSRDK